MFIKPKYIAILDIGSSSVIAYASERTSDGLLSIKASSEQTYEGYQKGEFFSLESLSKAVAKAMDDVCAKTSHKLQTVYVGTPGEFVKVVTKNVSLDFDQDHRVTDDDINKLFALGDTFQNDMDWQLVNSSAIYYTIDGNKRLIEPRGCVVIKNIELFASYILCNSSFATDVQALLTSKTDNVKFVSSDWAQAISLIDPDKRDQGALLCDIGYISSSVMLIRGDGIIDHAAFSNGGGFIASDLAFCLEVPFKTAEQIKDMLDLNLACEEEDEFDLTDKRGANFKAQHVNDIVCARIDDICENINKSIAGFNHKVPQYLKVYLTGGGITGVRGASRVLSETLNRAVEVISPSLPSFNKPRYASSVGIMEVVARWEQNKVSIIKKLFANK